MTRRATGVGLLLWVALRSARLRLAAWVLFVGSIPLLVASSFARLYPDVTARAGFASAATGNAALTAMFGPLTGSGIGQLVVWRAGFLPVVVALAAGFLVIRQARGEEEAGRTGLLVSTAVDRRAPGLVAVFVGLAFGLVVGALVAVTMALHGEPAGGSVLFGSQYLASAWVYTGVAAVSSQIAASARGARGLLGAVVGAAFLLRMVGDLSKAGDGRFGWLGWISPFGWIAAVDPYGAGRTGWLLPTVLLTVVLLGAAAVQLDRRDLSSGVLAVGSGVSEASATLASSKGLALRLHRGPLFAWTCGFVVSGLVLGAVTGSLDELVAGDASLRAMLARAGGRGDPTDAYLAVLASWFGLITAAFAIQTVLRLHSEEEHGRTDLVLAGAQSRLGWATPHVLVATVGSAALLGTVGSTLGLVYGVSRHDPTGQVGRVLAAMLVQLPAVWVVAAFSVVLVGAFPRMSGASWAVIGWCMLVGLLATVLDVGRWLIDLSPFTHVPHLPGGRFDPVPLVVLTAVAVLLAGAGLAGLVRRDVPGT